MQQVEHLADLDQLRHRGAGGTGRGLRPTGQPGWPQAEAEVPTWRLCSAAKQATGRVGLCLVPMEDEMSETDRPESPAAVKRAVTEEELAGLIWYGAPGDTEGPQIAVLRDGYVLMRHGADHGVPFLVYTPSEWAKFQLGAADGEFDEVEQQTPDAG
ncbi:hypothetical protein ACPC54_27380 [Kitasatospora sp. NPDC094028]